MEEEPPKSTSRAGRVLDLVLQNYLFVPSQQGFSAYRSGWFVHVVFSVLVAAGIYAGLFALGADLLSALIAATLGVVLLWGAGIWLGVVSHYIPLITLAAMGIVGGMMFYEPTMKYVGPGILVAFAAHIAIMPVLIFVLRQVRKLFP